MVIDSDSVAAIHNVAMELSEEPISCCYILLLWRLKAPAADINVSFVFTTLEYCKLYDHMLALIAHDIAQKESLLGNK